MINTPPTGFFQNIANFVGINTVKLNIGTNEI